MLYGGGLGDQDQPKHGKAHKRLSPKIPQAFVPRPSQCVGYGADFVRKCNIYESKDQKLRYIESEKPKRKVWNSYSCFHYYSEKRDA